MKTNHTLLLLIVMVIFCPLAVDIYLPGVPAIATEFQVRPELVQWSVGLLLVSVGIGQLFFGPLSDRLGRRPVLLFGVVLYGLASLLSVLATNIEVLLLSRVLQGLGACAIMVVAFAHVRDSFDPQRSSAIYSYMSAVICCIPALAPVLGHILIALAGWRASFYFMLFYALAALPLMYVLFKPQAKITQQQSSVLSVFAVISKHPQFLFHSLLVMLSMAVIIAYVSHSPVWIIYQLNGTEQDFIFWFGLNAVLNILAYFVTPKLLKRFGAQNMVEYGVLLVLAAGLLMLMLQPISTGLRFMLPIFVSSTGIAMLLGASSALALAPFAHCAGAASAVLGFMQMCGAALLVFLLQLLPVSLVEQIALLMLLFLPMWLLLKLTSIKQWVFNPG